MSAWGTSLGFLAFAASFASALSAEAATIAAASCSSLHVQTAITSAAAGDTVVVPAGNCTWTSTVRITSKALTLRGAGVGATNDLGLISGQ